MPMLERQLTLVEAAELLEVRMDLAVMVDTVITEILTVDKAEVPLVLMPALMPMLMPTPTLKQVLAETVHVQDTKATNKVAIIRFIHLFRLAQTILSSVADTAVAMPMLQLMLVPELVEVAR